MKTAMHKLIEYFEQQLSLQKNSQIKYTGGEAYFDALDVCKNALKEEKLQWTGAYVQAKMENHTMPYGVEYLNKVAKAEEEAERHYNETFNQ